MDTETLDQFARLVYERVNEDVAVTPWAEMTDDRKHRWRRAAAAVLQVLVLAADDVASGMAK